MGKVLDFKPLIVTAGAVGGAPMPSAGSAPAADTRTPAERERDSMAEQCAETAYQLRHMQQLLWLALHNRGPLRVSLIDVMVWPSERVLHAEKEAGSEKIVWKAITRQVKPEAKPENQKPATAENQTTILSEQPQATIHGPAA